MMDPVPLKSSNPFAITKAVDLNDEQIQSLWVDVSGGAEQFAEFARPTSPMPTFILGAKGSGKTHLMRYHAFELQTLRYSKQALAVRDGVRRDGYIGIYMRCSGLNSGRFNGKGQPTAVWNELFAYYIELWLTQHLLHVIQTMQLGEADGDELDLCRQIISLFDKAPSSADSTISALATVIGDMQRHLDFEVNNCVISGKIDVKILATRGRLVFGIPKLLAERYAFLRDVLFVYSIDEFENLTINQQKLINTLVREKELPSTLRIGSRLYGVKTNATDSAEEENLRNSEFEVLSLDQLFRTHKRHYSTFAKKLIEKRLAAAFGLFTDKHVLKPIDIDWHSFFETYDDSWNSEAILTLVKGKPSAQRRHFILLKEKLISGGLTPKAADTIVGDLSSTAYPLLEKTNVLLLYQDMYDNKQLLTSSSEIRAMCGRFAQKPSERSRYASTLEHYKTDLLAQLHRENDSRQYYLGLDNFITMSAGLPRALLTILRSVFEWSLFNGEDPLRTHHLSKEAQLRGVRDASDWFYENMRKAGDDGIAIQTAIDRIARLFRLNRFADKPVECSLIAFSIAEQDANPEALRILRLAESRSFLNRVSGGQRDKNSERVTMKFQINNMLSPRWDLPLGRRGAVTLEPRQFDAIFDPRNVAEFEEVLSEWREKMTAPNFGKPRSKHSSAELPQRALF